MSRFQNKSVFSVCFFVIEITDNGSNSLLALFFVDEFQFKAWIRYSSGSGANLDSNRT